TELFFGHSILAKSPWGLQSVAGNSMVRNSNQTADAIHASQRARVKVRDNQQTAGLQDAAHLRQRLCGLGEMDYQANECCIKALVRKRRCLAVFQLERYIRSFDSFPCHREHAWSNVSGNDSVGRRYQCLRVKPSAATKLHQLT